MNVVTEPLGDAVRITATADDRKAVVVISNVQMAIATHDAPLLAVALRSLAAQLEKAE